MKHNRIVSREEWLVARKQHLSKEKEFTRLRDELSWQRRELPWVRVEKRYVFDGPGGKETLARPRAEGPHRRLFGLYDGMGAPPRSVQ
jgi:predicted dithiol-disulfide oxidoreductase (DUF899 family)